jgi:16S rRNA C967 or C1407 C5-methylase (RsmB/RsmF family)
MLHLSSLKYCLICVSGEFALDAHIPSVLIFNSREKLHQNGAYLSGKLILQDKASCMSAVVISPPEGGEVIDATAAPGNKTSHLSALMKNKGRVCTFLSKSSLLPADCRLVIRIRERQRQVQSARENVEESRLQERNSRQRGFLDCRPSRS